MRTETTTETTTTPLYTFDELSDATKERALDGLRDINVDRDWWDFTYEDAQIIGLNITSFDLDRNRHACGRFIFDAVDVANTIIQEHGNQCETYQTAKEYLKNVSRAITEQCQDEADFLCTPLIDEIDLETIKYENDLVLEDQLEDLEAGFLQSLLEDYSIMLQKECEYLQSDEAIKDTIDANEYEFLENGDLY